MGGGKELAGGRDLRKRFHISISNKPRISPGPSSLARRRPSPPPARINCWTNTGTPSPTSFCPHNPILAGHLPRGTPGKQPSLARGPTFRS